MPKDELSSMSIERIRVPTQRIYGDVLESGVLISAGTFWTKDHDRLGEEMVGGKKMLTSGRSGGLAGWLDGSRKNWLVSGGRREKKRRTRKRLMMSRRFGLN